MPSPSGSALAEACAQSTHMKYCNCHDWNGVGAITVIVTSLADCAWLSSAVRRRSYVPAVSNVAVVFVAFALPKVVAPGPLTSLQVVVNTPGGLGSPSSVAVQIGRASCR